MQELGSMGKKSMGLSILQVLMSPNWKSMFLSTPAARAVPLQLASDPNPRLLVENRVPD